MDDGFILLGDLVEMRPDKSIKILERKKNIFKTLQSGGIFISPEYLENLYTQAVVVSELYFYGDDKRDYCVAAVSPNKDVVLKFAQENNLKGSYEELCQHKDVIKFVHEQMM